MATLAERLEQIKNIKQQYRGRYYVGTQEALNYVRAHERIERQPQEIADTVNQSLENNFYTATPDRIAGVIRMFMAAEEYAKEEEKDAGLEFDAMSFFFMEEGKRVSEVSPAGLISHLETVFQAANASSVKDDDTFQEFLEVTYMPELLAKRCGLTDILRLEIEPKSFAATYDEERATAQNHAQIYLDPKRIVARIYNDRVDAHSDFRRAVLDAFLNAPGIDYLTQKEISEPDVAIKELLSYADTRIKERTKRLDKMVKLKMPKPIIESERLLAQEATYIRECLGREKSYVLQKIEKFLQS